MKTYTPLLTEGTKARGGGRASTGCETGGALGALRCCSGLIGEESEAEKAGRDAINLMATLGEMRYQVESDFNVFDVCILLMGSGGQTLFIKASCLCESKKWQEQSECMLSSEVQSSICQLVPPSLRVKMFTLFLHSRAHQGF